MTRWEPNARERLAQAALDLYIDRGFDQATVAEIARRAGLTERTFFRYFADKREVLFWGQSALEEIFVGAIAAASDPLVPIDAVAAALEGTGAVFQRREFSRQRQTVIAANPELQERELLKRAALASAIARALRDRGVPEPTASLTAETGMVVFKVAFGRWLTEADERDFRQVVRSTLSELKDVTGGRAVPSAAGAV